MVNKYPGDCAVCGSTVPANGGVLVKRGIRLKPIHLACAEGSSVDEFVIGGKSYTRNRNGTCEDAPCCGCCTI